MLQVQLNNTLLVKYTRQNTVIYVAVNAFALTDYFNIQVFMVDCKMTQETPLLAILPSVSAIFACIFLHIFRKLKPQKGILSSLALSISSSVCSALCSTPVVYIIIQFFFGNALAFFFITLPIMLFYSFACSFAFLLILLVVIFVTRKFFFPNSSRM